MTVLLLTDQASAPYEVLPALCAVPYTVKVRPAALASPEDSSREDPSPQADIVLVDAREDLAGAKRLCRKIRGTVPDRPLIAVFTQAGLITLNTGWRVDDVVLDTTGTDELAMRFRMATARRARDPARARLTSGSHAERRHEKGPLRVDLASRTVTLCGEKLDLTYTEFEIVACLARRPGQIVDHQVMLDHLYAGEPRGTTRALHTHIRRIRRKLGPEHARLIACVHGVGYRLQTA